MWDKSHKCEEDEILMLFQIYKYIVLSGEDVILIIYYFLKSFKLENKENLLE